jgi:N4-gp56 family major capsid protein
LADAYTTTASSGLDHAAYNVAIDYALRSTLHFVPIADVRPTAQAMPGTSVTFTLIDDMAVASTALNESVDVDAVAVTDSAVTLTLAEYGNAVIRTAKLAGTSLVPVDPIISNLIARNAAESLDTLAVIQLRAGSNVIYGSAGPGDPVGRTSVDPTDTVAADDFRKIYARLRAANVADYGGWYLAFIHPDVVYDFMSDTGGTGWTTPANYSAAERRWNGEIGTFNGIKFISTPTAPKFADAGSSTTLTDVYATLVLGRTALAMAHSYTGGWREMPIVELGPVTDKLRRFQPYGWKWLGAFGRYREAALWRLESASAIGTNT